MTESHGSGAAHGRIDGEAAPARTMRAAVLDRPGPVTNLRVREVAVPQPPPGWVRVRVEAFGLNRSELHTRLGLAEGVTFPRVLGIEASGTVDLDTDGVLAHGTQVVAMMGGMGRTFDGGYAQYTVVPRVHGTVCFAGMLSNQWTVRDFYPIDYLPNGVRLTAYAGEAADLPPAVLQEYLDQIADGTVTLGPVHAYPLERIQQAHADLESGRHVGKLVGLPWA